MSVQSFTSCHQKASPVSPYLVCTCKTLMLVFTSAEVLTSPWRCCMQLSRDYSTLAPKEVENTPHSVITEWSDCQTEGMVCSVTAQTRGTHTSTRVDLLLYRKTRLSEGCTENTKTPPALQLNCKFRVRIWFSSLPVSCAGSDRTEMCSLEESSILWTQANKVVWERHTRKQCLLLGHLWLCPKDGKMYIPRLSLCLTLPWMLCTWYD